MKKNRQTNQYDKIFRENLESFIPTLMVKLRVLIGLRKLGVKIDDIMDSLMDYIVEEEDVLFKRGVKKNSMKIIENMVKKTDLSDLSIADVVSVSVELVQEIRLRLQK